MHHQNRDALADHGKPAQPHERVEADAAPSRAMLIEAGHAALYRLGCRLQNRRDSAQTV
jgi:hypothetical protein